MPPLPDRGVDDVVMDGQPIKSEGGEESLAGHDHLADVLSPLEQILFAADQELGAIRERVDAEAGHDAERMEQRVHEATLEGRRRVALMRTELTDRASALASCYEEMLDLLDQAEHYLAMRARSLESGNPTGAVKVTMTERRRLTFAHDQPPAIPAQPLPEMTTIEAPEPAAPPAQDEGPAGEAAAAPESGEPAEPGESEQRGIRRWWRRLTRSAA